jgi:hypothetical protein
MMNLFESSIISYNQSLPAETNTFSKEGTFFPLGSTNESASAFKVLP